MKIKAFHHRRKAPVIHGVQIANHGQSHQNDHSNIAGQIGYVNNLNSSITDLLQKSILNNGDHLEVDDNLFNDDPLLARSESELKNSDNGYAIFNVHGRKHLHDKQSLFIFNNETKLRQWIVWLINFKPFENCIMLIIISNSLLIACYDFSDRGSLTMRNQIIDKIQVVFQIIFVIECILKIIAMGLIHKRNSYLRSGWNIMDFIVITLGVVDLASNQTNLKSLRTLRVLQPLRNITQYEKLRQLANTLIKALPSFGNVSIFLVLVFIIFSTFGLQMHSDSFYWRCRITEKPLLSINANGKWVTVWEKDPNQNIHICSPNGQGLYTCSPGTFCGSPFKEGLNTEFDSVLDETFINYGVLTFDNIAKSLLSVFQIITNDNWAATMYNLMDADISWMVPIYLCLIVIFGSFFLINIILAVILEAFISVQQDDIAVKIVFDPSGFQKDLQQIDNQLNQRVYIAERRSILAKKAFERTIKIKNSFYTDEDEINPEPEPKINFSNQEIDAIDLHQVLDEEQEKKRVNQHLMEYLRDKLKQDIDIMKNSIAKNQQPGQIQRLTALKNTYRVVDDKGKDIKQKFQVNMSLLRKISIRRKSNTLYKTLHCISQSKFFTNYFIPVMIILNTGVLAAERYPGDDSENKILDVINYVFYFVFAFELILKLTAVGIRAYFIDPYNRFDAVLFVFSSVDTILNTYLLISKASSEYDIVNRENTENITHSVLQTIRAFRLLRIFKLASTWKRFGDLLKTIWKTLKDISTFSLFLLLFTFIYTLLGMELFAFGCKKSIDDKIDMENGTYPLNNFNSFYEAFLTMFVLLTGDQWTAIMLDFYRAVNPTLALIFFVSFMILGQFMLLNLFLAILLQNFDEDSIEQDMQQKLLRKEQISKAIFQKKIERLFENMWIKITGFFLRVFPQKIKKDVDETPKNDHEDLDPETFKYVDKERTKKKAKVFLKKINRVNDGAVIKGHLIQMEGHSLFLFSLDSIFRRNVYRLVHNNIFEIFILLVIVLSTVQLALESPLNEPGGHKQIILSSIDLSTTIIFTLEMLMKIISYGFLFNGENSYMRSKSNLLDFFVTSLSVAIQALTNAITNVFNVLVISVLFFMVIGIVGVNQFKGQFSYCLLDHTPWPKVRLTGQLFYKQDCFNYGGEWLNKNRNFDNIKESMMTLFQMSTLSDWLNVMYDGMSVTGIETDFILKYTPVACIYFIMFVLVGAFFTLNLFVGIVISTYNREKEKLAKDFLLKERQKEWLYAKQLVFRQKLQVIIQKHNNRFRNFLLEIQKSKRFEYFILWIIILNSIVLMIKWAGEPIAVTLATEILNYIFTAIFTLEMLIKMIALGKFYLREQWNIFDALVIILTYIFIAVSSTTQVNLGPQVTLLRSFRLLRIFKYFKATKSLKILFNTFLVTLPAMTSIGGLLALLIYVYAVMGVNLFGEVELIAPMNYVQNFQSFGCAFLLLIKIATGDGWAEIMDIMSKQSTIYNQCVINPTYQDYVANGYQTLGCGNSQTAVLYFYSYLLVVKLIFLNLFIAVILEGFEAVNVQERRTLNSDLIEKFREAWEKFDSQASGFIKIYELKNILIEIGAPLAWGNMFNENQAHQQKFINDLNLPIYNSFQDYQYVDVILALCRRLLIEDEVKQSVQQNPRLDQKMLRLFIEQDIDELDKNDQSISSVKRLKKQEKKIRTERDKSHQGNVFTARHEEAARSLIKHLRIYVSAQKMKKGIQVIKHTREQLEEIDRKLMLQFKKMAGATDEQDAMPLISANNILIQQETSRVDIEDDTQRHLNILNNGSLNGSILSQVDPQTREPSRISFQGNMIPITNDKKSTYFKMKQSVSGDNQTDANKQLENKNSLSGLLEGQPNDQSQQSNDSKQNQAKSNDQDEELIKEEISAIEQEIMNDDNKQPTK